MTGVAPRQRPEGTYRLQLWREFDLHAARALVGYLSDLGVRDMYVSPLLMACAGSRHGYDAVDPTRLNPELGDTAALQQLATELGKHDMGLVLDIVPNHMSIGTDENPFWNDVQARGKESAYSHWFDIDWDTGGYRRYADIDQLAALRIEDPDVLRETHALVAKWVADGWVTGLRVDHPDGLRDVEAFLRGIKNMMGQGLYVVVEKPMGPNERLPETFAADGTTGYDFLALVSDLSIDVDNESAMRAIYRDFTGRTDDFAATRKRGKQEAVRSLFSKELVQRARQLAALSSEISEPQAARVLTALLVNFPVGRLNLSVGADLSDEDTELLERASHDAASDLENPDRAALEFAVTQLGTANDFALRFMQLSGPVGAKGIEDTALYRDATFLALNEVGGDPGRFGSSPKAFHARNQELVKTHPFSMSATSTHDTKRSEDVRARLAVLSEIPEAWQEAVTRWRTLNHDAKSAADVPNDYEEYFLYQTLVGAWPIEALTQEPSADFVVRMQAYLRKAFREAKERSNWFAPDEAFEKNIVDFVAAILRRGPFVADMQKFLAHVVRAGLMNSLSQVVLKVASPGIPDTYQGNELWDFSLVDPDNRRAVDFERRRQLLAGLEKNDLHEYLADPYDGRIKLFVLSRALAARNRNPALFTLGDYQELAVDGAPQKHVVAFARQHEGHRALCLTGRLLATTDDAVWEGASLRVPSKLAGRYRDVFSGVEVAVHDRQLHLSDVFAHLPVALLESIE